MLRITNLYHHYAEQMILKNINLEFPSQTLCAIVGQSGCGKTTLLKLLAGVLEIQSGSILFTEQLKSKHAISYVPQKMSLVPCYDVLGNITLPLRLLGMSKKQAIETALPYLKEFHLQKIAHAYPNQISGGQAQKITLIRSLVTKPQLLLLDEPFSSIDPLGKRYLQEFLHQLKLKYQLTIILVTHDLEEAVRLANNIYIIKDGQLSTQMPINIPQDQRFNQNAAAEIAVLKEKIYHQV